MGQIFFLEDKIGQLSESAGVITLQPSRLTIGGQQYETSTLTRTITDDVALAARTRYQVYLVKNGTALELRVSQNENSVGPAGFVSWKLVGSFMTDGASAFTAFLAIDRPNNIEVKYTRTLAISSTTSFVVVNFNSQDYDDFNTVTTGVNWAFAAPVPGIYHVKSQANIGTAGAQNHQMEIRVNSTREAVGYTKTSNGLFYLATDSAFDLSAGDEVDVRIQNGTGSVPMSTGPSFFVVISSTINEVIKDL